jgi:F-type H+-transporting ATPase subunit alpha
MSDISYSTDAVIEALKKRIAGTDIHAEDRSVGVVSSVRDGIVSVSGLSEVGMSEMIRITPSSGDDVLGVVMNLEEGIIGAMILGEYLSVKEGDIVVGTGRVLETPAGEALIGRVVNPLGQPLDGKGPISGTTPYPMEKIAPGVVTRKSVSVPMHTGIKAIDAMVPIGRGQRELIIGDRQTGKTAVAIDAIINQRGKDVICVYVAIGQKESKVASIVSKLEHHGAMEYTIVVLAGASDPASLSYIAPYAGTAMAEYFLEKGKDVLIVYDDLSKHAVAYRELSLLLRRPPGREAYPGDVFYVHSRLLERACRLDSPYGGGSITALPIIETQAGDVSAYIPTNVISITDGQIYLETDLFHQGVRPAVNAGLSVSRVGSSAQTKLMKKVAGKMRLEAAQYRELAAFAQFGSDIDEETRNRIEHGKRLMEVLKQDQYAPLSDEEQAIVFFALIEGYLADVDVADVRDFERGLLAYIRTSGADTIAEMKQGGMFTEAIEARLRALIEAYKDGRGERSEKRGESMTE